MYIGHPSRSKARSELDLDGTTLTSESDTDVRWGDSTDGLRIIGDQCSFPAEHTHL